MNLRQRIETILDPVRREYNGDEPMLPGDLPEIVARLEALVEQYANERLNEEIEALQRHTYANKDSVVLDGTPGGRPGFSTESARTMAYLQGRRAQLKQGVGE